MKKLKIALLSSVFTIGLGQAAHAVYVQDQLVTLRNLVNAGNADQIMAYINANPQLLDGTDPLAEALRDFVASRNTFTGRLFGVRLPNLDQVPDLPPGVSSEVMLASGSLSEFGS